MKRFHLVGAQTSKDVVEVLEDLLEEARRGEIIGMAYCAMYSHKHYMVDTAGECRRNPTFTRGMVRALDDRLAVAVGSKTKP